MTDPRPALIARADIRVRELDDAYRRGVYPTLMEDGELVRDLLAALRAAEVREQELRDELEQVQFDAVWGEQEHQIAVKAIQQSETLDKNHFPSFQERVWWKTFKERADAAEAACQRLTADLQSWRTWAQFVYGNGGPVSGTDVEMRALVCEAHDKQVTEIRIAAEAARDQLREKVDRFRGMPAARLDWVFEELKKRFPDPAPHSAQAYEGRFFLMLDNLLAARDQMQATLQTLVDKLVAVHADPRYLAVWQMYQLHGGRYTEPTYTQEFEAARAALASLPATAKGNEK